MADKHEVVDGFNELVEEFWSAVGDEDLGAAVAGDDVFNKGFGNLDGALVFDRDEFDPLAGGTLHDEDMLESVDFGQVGHEVDVELGEGFERNGVAYAGDSWAVVGGFA